VTRGARLRNPFALVLLACAVPAAEAVTVDPSRPLALPSAVSEIEVDGRLDEAAWDTALQLELPFEVQPAENAPAPVVTRALLTYDTERLYVAFRAFDPEPESIRARLADRDSAFQDDFVGVVVDTFDDQRRAFEFMANPLGVQMDMVLDGVTGREDAAWNAIWSSAGRLAEDGFVVEMAVPFSSLRFQDASDEQVWGIDLVRNYPRDRRRLLALNRRERGVSCYLCQLSKVEGFAGASPGRNLEINPTVTAVQVGERADLDAPFQRLDPDAEAGVTVRWGPTPSVFVSGTINPDFSQVEADVARLAVNEQFALFYPERRPFFLEAAELFDSPVRAVHTRTIADPAWGAKLAGKRGPHAFGGFVAQDELTGLLLPGPQSSSLASLESASTAGVLRYRRDLGRSSALGALATHRAGGDYRNTLAGFDAALRPTDADTFRAQLLGSSTTDPASIGGTGEAERDRALELNWRRETRRWTSRVGYTDYGQGFRADLGYVPRVGFRRGVAALEHRWLGGSEQWYSEIELGGDWNRTEEQDGQLIEDEIEGWLKLAGGMQSFFMLNGGVRDRGYRERTFEQQFAHLFGRIRPTRDLELVLRVWAGDDIDYAYDNPADPGDARQGALLRIDPALTYRLGRRLRLSASHEHRRLEDAAGELFRAGLTEARIIYQFGVRSFVRAVLQRETVDRNLARYPGCAGDPAGAACGLEAESEGVFGQLLFSYKVNPQTAVFVGYSDQREAYGPNDLVRTGESLFLKLSYAWVL
jgi:hypothetical protein